MMKMRLSIAALMVVLLCGVAPCLAFATPAADAQADAHQVALQDDTDINDCEFKYTGDWFADSSGTWALAFVHGLEEGITPEFALYDKGEEVDAGKYTVAYESFEWIDDDEVVKPAQIPLTVGSYRIIVKAKEGSGYSGTYEDNGEMPTVQVADVYQIGSPYTDLYFTNESVATRDMFNPMNRNYYLVPVSSAKSFMDSFEVRVGGASDVEEDKHEGAPIIKDKDYTVAYYNADRKKRTEDALSAIVGDPLGEMPSTVGTYVLKVTGVGSYFGEKAVLIDIQEKMENVSVAAIPDQKYTGTAIKPKLTVTYDGKTLVEGTDFAVEYKNNTAAGKASAVLSGVNPFLKWHFDPATHAVEFIPSGQDRFFDGAKTVTFNIVKEPQPMKATASSKTLKAKNLKKKAVTYAPIKVVNAKGKVTYQVVGGNAKSKKALKLNTGNGKVTVQKKTKKGSYMIQVKVTAAGTSTGNPQYAAGSQTVKVAVKVK